MAFVFAYGLDGDLDVAVADFTPAGTYTPKAGDVVKLDGSGNVIAGVGGASDTSALGVCEGANFTGLVAGTPVVSTNNPGNVAKVRIGSQAVYRVPLKAAATTPVVGTAYGTAIVSGDFQLDTAVTAAGAIYTVVSYDSATRNVFVTIKTRIMN